MQPEVDPPSRIIWRLRHSLKHPVCFGLKTTALFVNLLQSIKCNAMDVDGVSWALYITLRFWQEPVKASLIEIFTVAHSNY